MSQENLTDRPVILVVDDLKDSYASLVQGVSRYRSGKLSKEFDFEYASCYPELRDWYLGNRGRFVSLIIQDVDFSHTKDERRLVGYPELFRPMSRTFDTRALQGLLIYGYLRQENIDRTTPVVFVSGRVGMETTREFANFMVNPGYGSCAFVPESAVGEQFYPRIAESIDALALRPLDDGKRLHWRDHHHMVVGRARRMASLVHEVERIGPLDAIVLLLGKPGVGKELVANALHRCSGRYMEADPARKYPCTVNMAALGKSLIEDELFGHERGAYTGAAGERAGIFEAARGSTVFLDEIGEIDKEIQSKLLRTIEYHRVKRIGASIEIEVEMRIVATTNRPMEDLQKLFRPDFYSRLVQHCILVPSLRERWEGEPGEVVEYDLKQMFDYVIDQMNRDTRNKRRIRMERTAVRFVRQLVEEHIDGSNEIFDGNMRTLRNIIERAYERAQYDGSKEIGFGHIIPTLAFQRLTHAQAEASSEPAPTLEALVGTLNLAQIERKAIAEALAKANHNQSKAAELLGVHRDTLRRKLEDKEPK
jgi:two-component system nitrogen regulation response regulator GlnG